MSAAVMGRTFEDPRVRTRWTMTLSIVVHALLLAWLVMFPVRDVVRTPAVEIAWLEGGMPGGEPAAPPAPAASAPVRNEGAAVAHADPDEHFRRATPRADLAPTPQSDLALADRLEARLATLQGTSSRPMPSVAASPAPASLWSGPATPVASGTGAGGVSLKRGGSSGTGPALALTRLGGAGTAPAPALVPTRAAEAAAPARESGVASHRTIAGASLIGPVADRPVLHSALPVYPEWAKRDAVEGSVTLYFVVRSDGSVKENVLVQKTAGFEDFDDSARTALRAWRFEPLREGRTGEQWGTITFHFRLRDAG